LSISQVRDSLRQRPAASFRRLRSAVFLHLAYQRLNSFRRRAQVLQRLGWIEGFQPVNGTETLEGGGLGAAHRANL
jgi:hypothetical protein